jgi:hypothetical protein
MGWDKERYATDPDYRERELATARRWRRANRAKINASQRLRSAEPDYPERKRRHWLRK